MAATLRTSSVSGRLRQTGRIAVWPFLGVNAWLFKTTPGWLPLETYVNNALFLCSALATAAAGFCWRRQRGRPDLSRFCLFLFAVTALLFLGEAAYLVKDLFFAMDDIMFSVADGFWMAARATLIAACLDVIRRRKPGVSSLRPTALFMTAFWCLAAGFTFFYIVQPFPDRFRAFSAAAAMPWFAAVNVICLGVIVIAVVWGGPIGLRRRPIEFWGLAGFIAYLIADMFYFAYIRFNAWTFFEKEIGFVAAYMFLASAGLSDVGIDDGDS